MCFSPSPKTMRTVTLLGAGILVGTALIIIIPEGIHLWYDALAAGGHEHEHGHGHHNNHAEHEEEEEEVDGKGVEGDLFKLENTDGCVLTPSAVSSSFILSNTHI